MTTLQPPPKEVEDIIRQLEDSLDAVDKASKRERELIDQQRARFWLVQLWIPFRDLVLSWKEPKHQSPTENPRVQPPSPE